MKTYLISSLRSMTVMMLFAVALTATTGAQSLGGATAGQIQIDALDRLASRAVESVNVNLNEQLLKLVPPILSKEDPDEANARELIAGLHGIYVRHLKFEAEGAYADADVAGIRTQLRGPEWTRIVEVVSRREGVKNLEVYMATTSGHVDGLVVLSVEPKEITVINIVGTIDIEKLRKLEGNFGVPEMELERDETKAPKKAGVTVTRKP